MLRQCLDQGEYKQAIGIALEARRLDLLEACIALVKAKGKDVGVGKGQSQGKEKKGGSGSTEEEDLFQYIMQVAMQVVDHLQFRNQVYLLLCLFHCYCLIFLYSLFIFCIHSCFLFLHSHTFCIFTGPGMHRPPVPILHPPRLHWRRPVPGMAPPPRNHGPPPEGPPGETRGTGVVDGVSDCI